MGATGNVIHAYAVMLSSADDADFLAKGLEAAAHGQLVPDAKCQPSPREFTAAVAAGWDQLPVGSQTRIDLNQEVRERAYHLWEQGGRTDGRSEEYWHRVMDEHLRERAYVLWQQHGSPEGRADENPRQVRDFQANWPAASDTTIGGEIGGRYRRFA